MGGLGTKLHLPRAKMRLLFDSPMQSENMNFCNWHYLFKSTTYGIWEFPALISQQYR